MEMKISLIISVYNRADFLKKVLASITRLNRKPDELIIAEDGKFPEIENAIKEWKEIFNFPVVHLSQEDKGNRKTLAVNRAVAHSSHPYLVFIDGDCILHRDFLAEHEKAASEGYFLTGRRVELSEKASRYLAPDRIQEGYLEDFPLYLYIDALFGKTHHLGRFFKCPKWALNLLKQSNVLDIRGCNLSLWRSDFMAVNGYSNDFSGAYGEDSDLEYRLRNYGVKMKSVRGRALQYHLWHAQQEKDQENQIKLTKVKVASTFYTSNGLREIDQLPS